MKSLFDLNTIIEGTYYEKMVRLLGSDLDFHSRRSDYASHNFHAFPAKFPPQLPELFITNLTEPGQVVLDPMCGSGTTLVEAFLHDRQGIGLDIDPLALMISRVKTTPLDPDQVLEIDHYILKNATLAIENEPDALSAELAQLWDPKTREFIDYWFLPETQIELFALLRTIRQIADPALRRFFELGLSAIIITKSGGVSLALDLAHTRPHRAKFLIKDGQTIKTDQDAHVSKQREKYVTKRHRPVLDDFQKRVTLNLNSLFASKGKKASTHFGYSDAQFMPLAEASVDLIVTSPPYASNAIDYMRAHKFSLTWLGYEIEDLGQKRQDYIGGEATSHFEYELLPRTVVDVVDTLAQVDSKKAQVVHRYYSEMARVLAEMYRVLKPDKAAVLVVGNSIIRGQDTQIPECLAEIGRDVGFDVPKIGERNLDRNRRMLPSSEKTNLDSQIQQRMHKEYVLGFYKAARPHGGNLNRSMDFLGQSLALL